MGWLRREGVRRCSERIATGDASSKKDRTDKATITAEVVERSNMMSMYVRGTGEQTS
jgi:hypothetical protein